jgi:hypothetical protein
MANKTSKKIVIFFLIFTISLFSMACEDILDSIDNVLEGIGKPDAADAPDAPDQSVGPQDPGQQDSDEVPAQPDSQGDPD